MRGLTSSETLTDLNISLSHVRTHMNSVTFNILKLILHVNSKILSQNYNKEK